MVADTFGFGRRFSAPDFRHRADLLSPFGQAFRDRLLRRADCLGKQLGLKGAVPLRKANLDEATDKKLTPLVEMAADASDNAKRAWYQGAFQAMAGLLTHSGQ